MFMVVSYDRYLKIVGLTQDNFIDDQIVVDG